MRVQRMALLVHMRPGVHDRALDEVQNGPAGCHRLVGHIRHSLKIRGEVQIVLGRVHIGLVASERRSQDRYIQ
ncbi:hypothetical protein GCM10009742_49280 [Kribbella karoonensis]|uniref:Uncharacterized protein n=1 Tax=Kribbella karoonensis TaxID=324851 RepID=A0ABN2E4Z0_9ACTN